MGISTTINQIVEYGIIMQINGGFMRVDILNY